MYSGLRIHSPHATEPKNFSVRLGSEMRKCVAAGSKALEEMGKRGNVLGLDVVSAEAENGVAKIGVERAARIEEIARLVGGGIGEWSGLWIRVGFGL